MAAMRGRVVFAEVTNVSQAADDAWPIVHKAPWLERAGACFIGGKNRARLQKEAADAAPEGMPGGAALPVGAALLLAGPRKPDDAEASSAASAWATVAPEAEAADTQAEEFSQSIPESGADEPVTATGGTEHSQSEPQPVVETAMDESDEEQVEAHDALRDDVDTLTWSLGGMKEDIDSLKKAAAAELRESHSEVFRKKAAHTAEQETKDEKLRRTILDIRTRRTKAVDLATYRLTSIYSGWNIATCQEVLFAWNQYLTARKSEEVVHSRDVGYAMKVRGIRARRLIAAQKGNVSLTSFFNAHAGSICQDICTVWKEYVAGLKSDALLRSTVKVLKARHLKSVHIAVESSMKQKTRLEGIAMLRAWLHYVAEEREEREKATAQRDSEQQRAQLVQADSKRKAEIEAWQKDHVAALSVAAETLTLAVEKHHAAMELSAAEATKLREELLQERERAEKTQQEKTKEQERAEKLQQELAEEQDKAHKLQQKLSEERQGVAKMEKKFAEKQDKAVKMQAELAEEKLAEEKQKLTLCQQEMAESLGNAEKVKEDLQKQSVAEHDKAQKMEEKLTKQQEQLDKLKAEHNETTISLVAVTAELEVSKAGNARSAGELEVVQKEKEAARMSFEVERALLLRVQAESKDEVAAAHTKLGTEIAEKLAVQGELQHSQGEKATAQKDLEEQRAQLVQAEADRKAEVEAAGAALKAEILAKEARQKEFDKKLEAAEKLLAEKADSKEVMQQMLNTERSKVDAQLKLIADRDEAARVAVQKLERLAEERKEAEEQFAKTLAAERLAAKQERANLLAELEDGRRQHIIQIQALQEVVDEIPRSPRRR